MKKEPILRRYKNFVITMIMGTFLSLLVAVDVEASKGSQEQIIPILGITMENKPIGTVANILLSFQERDDDRGLIIQFRRTPGRFSRMAQTAIQQAIYRASRAAGMKPDS